MRKITLLGKKRDIKEAIFFAIMMAIPTIQFFIFYIGVNFNSIRMAFQEYDPTIGDFSYSLANFEKFFYEFKTTPYFKTSLLNSLTLALYSVGLNIILCLLFSLYIYKKQFGHKIFKVVLFIPSIVSSIVMVRIFHAMCDGIIPDIIGRITGEEIKGLIANRDTQRGMLIFFCLWCGFGPSMLIYVGAMSGIDESISEAARLDGANFLQESLFITLPLIYPTIVVQIVAGMSGILTNQMGLYSFFKDTADPTIETVGYWLYTELQHANGDISQYPYIATVGLLGTFITIPVVFVVRFLMNRFGPKTE